MKIQDKANPNISTDQEPCSKVPTVDAERPLKQTWSDYKTLHIVITIGIIM